MLDSLSEQFDRFFRAHPRLMLGMTVLVAIVATLVLIGVSKDQEIIYRFF